MKKPTMVYEYTTKCFEDFMKRAFGIVQSVKKTQIF